METFVTTPEIHIENTIGEDPMPPGQIWTMNMGGNQVETTGLYKIEINSGPGSGVSSPENRTVWIRRKSLF